MNRRRALTAFLVLAAGPRAARAQQGPTVRRIGVLRAAPDDAVFRRNYDPFRQALRENGFTDGGNLSIEYRVSPGTAQEMLARATDLVRLKIDAILAIAAQGVAAAGKATTTVPIVAVDLESDPIASGFVSNLGRPGGNITGLFLDFPELSGKWIQFLKEAMPKLAHAAVLWDPSIGPYLLKGAEDAGASMQVQISRLEARKSADLAGAFESASRQKVEAVLALSSPVFASARKEIARLAMKYRLPAIMPFPDFADDGGLMAYGPQLTGMFRQAGGVMARILQGARPMDIPVERPARFELAVNLRTAKSLGVMLPPSLLLRADRVIE